MCTFECSVYWVHLHCLYVHMCRIGLLRLELPVWELGPGLDSPSLGSYWPPVALHLGLRPCGICPLHIGMIAGIVIIAGRIRAVIFWEFLNATSELFVLRPYPYIVTQCGPFWSHVLTYFYHSSPAQMCIQTHRCVSFWIFGSRQHTCPNASLCISNTTAMQLADSGHSVLSSTAHIPVLPLVSFVAFSYRGWHQST